MWRARADVLRLLRQLMPPAAAEAPAGEGGEPQALDHRPRGEEHRGGAQQLLDCGIIRTEPGRSEGERMVEIARDLRVLIRTWKPQLAVVEKFFFYRSSTTIAVVQARGVLMMTLARFGVAVVEFPPMQINQALTGHGHAQTLEVNDPEMR
jgi:crossover junction endodeoxyribonuclease RuvC